MVSMRNLLILITVLWSYKKMCLFLRNTHKYLGVKRPDVFNLQANGFKIKQPTLCMHVRGERVDREREREW